jgi:hypothetical protein
MCAPSVDWRFAFGYEEVVPMNRTLAAIACFLGMFALGLALIVREPWPEERYNAVKAGMTEAEVRKILPGIKGIARQYAAMHYDEAAKDTVPVVTGDKIMFWSSEGVEIHVGLSKGVVTSKYIYKPSL